MAKLVVAMGNLPSAIAGSQEPLDIDDDTLSALLQDLERDSFAYRALSEGAAEIRHHLLRFIRECARSLAGAESPSVRQALLLLIDTASDAIESEQALCLWDADALEDVASDRYFKDEPVPRPQSRYRK
jgi:hypothetical protein